MIKFKIPSDENIIFESKKEKIYVIILSAIIVLISLFILYNAIQTLGSLFLGYVSFSSNCNYLFTTACFLLIIPILIFLIIYDFIPEIVLTDKKIYIHKFFESQYAIALDEHIVAFLHYADKGTNQYKMCLYFDNGGRFIYNSFCISNNSSIKLTELLQQKIQNKISTDGLETDSDYASKIFI